MSNGILLNDDYLSENFIPDVLINRDGQVKEISRCLEPALHNRRMENIFIHGDTGVGKTVVMKWILESHFKGIAAYINCWSNNSKHAILQETLSGIGEFVHGRESTKELTKRFEVIARKKKLVVCLDEIDQLKDAKVLYELARNNCGLIFISNVPHPFLNLDERVKSSLGYDEIEFKKYSSDEIMDILKGRANGAMKDGAVSPRHLKIISELAKGDARLAIETLRRAAKKAESKGISEVGWAEITEAFKSASRLRKSYRLDKLSDVQKRIYQILEKMREMQSGLLFKEYVNSSPTPVGRRAFKKNIRRLIEMKLIVSEGSGRATKYRVVF